MAEFTIPILKARGSSQQTLNLDDADNLSTEFQRYEIARINSNARAFRTFLGNRYTVLKALGQDEEAEKHLYEAEELSEV